MSVLLGTDVPELRQLLQLDPDSVHTGRLEEAMVVKTRVQGRVIIRIVALCMLCADRGLCVRDVARIFWSLLAILVRNYW